MITSLEDILAEVTSKGRCEVDSLWLTNGPMRGDLQKRLDDWTAANGIEWEPTDYDFGKGQRGQKIVFTRASPSAKDSQSKSRPTPPQ